MSKEGKGVDGRTIHQDYQGYFTLDNTGQRIQTDIHGSPIQDSNYDSQENVKNSGSILNYKGNNIFIKILLFSLKVIFTFFRELAKIAQKTVYGR